MLNVKTNIKNNDKKTIKKIGISSKLLLISTIIMLVSPGVATISIFVSIVSMIYCVKEIKKIVYLKNKELNEKIEELRELVNDKSTSKKDSEEKFMTKQIMNNVIQFDHIYNEGSRNYSVRIRTLFHTEVDVIYEVFNMSESQIKKSELKSVVNCLYDYFTYKDLDHRDYYSILRFVKVFMRNSFNVDKNVDIFTMIDSLDELKCDYITERDINIIKKNILSELKAEKVINLNEYQKVKVLE